MYVRSSATSVGGLDTQVSSRLLLYMRSSATCVSGLNTRGRGCLGDPLPEACLYVCLFLKLMYMFFLCVLRDTS